MTVWAQNPQIVKSVIVTNAIDMVKFKGDRSTQPLFSLALFTHRRLQTFSQQTLTQVSGRIR